MKRLSIAALAVLFLLGVTGCADQKEPLSSGTASPTDNTSPQPTFLSTTIEPGIQKEGEEGASSDASKNDMPDDEGNIIDVSGAEWAMDILRDREELAACYEAGMAMVVTGETENILDEDCVVIALGTDHETHFVKEYLFAIAPSGQAYVYDMIGDAWIEIEQYAGFMVATSLDDLLGTWIFVSGETEGWIYTPEDEGCETELEFLCDSAGVLWVTYRTRGINTDTEDGQTVQCRVLTDEKPYMLSSNAPWYTQFSTMPNVESYVSFVNKDVLLLENYFELDGSPAISIKYFERIN